MKTIRVEFRHYWKTFRPEHFTSLFPFLEPKYRLVQSDRPDVIFYSVFGRGLKRRREPIEGNGAIRVMHIGENVRPDMKACEFALSPFRDIDHPRHLRLPNYVPLLNYYGQDLGSLIKRGDQPERLLAQKKRFCAFIQGHDVERRNDFVRKLSKRRKVDCAGPCLNNTGFIVDRASKYTFLKDYKFVVAFENDSAPGYMTEKIVDGMFVRTMPIYWGDPEVHEDFNTESFFSSQEFSSDEELIEAILACDDDDELYLQKMREPYFHGDVLPAHGLTRTYEEFFDRIFAPIAVRREALVLADRDIPLAPSRGTRELGRQAVASQALTLVAGVKGPVMDRVVAERAHDPDMQVVNEISVLEGLQTPKGDSLAVKNAWDSWCAWLKTLRHGSPTASGFTFVHEIDPDHSVDLWPLLTTLENLHIELVLRSPSPWAADLYREGRVSSLPEAARRIDTLFGQLTTQTQALPETRCAVYWDEDCTTNYRDFLDPVDVSFLDSFFTDARLETWRSLIGRTNRALQTELSLAQSE